MHDPNSSFFFFFFFLIDKYYDTSLSFSRKDEGDMLLIGNRWWQALEKQEKRNGAVEPQAIAIDRLDLFTFLFLFYGSSCFPASLASLAFV